MKKFLIPFILIFMCSCSNNTSDSEKFINEFKKCDINIYNTSVIKYASLEDINNALNTSGIIIFGNPKSVSTCSIIGNLLEASDITGIDKIYYYNNENIINIDLLKEYDLTKNTVIFIRDGNILEVDSNDYEVLNEEESLKITDMYVNYMHEVLNDLCDVTC